MSSNYNHIKKELIEAHIIYDVINYYNHIVSHNLFLPKPSNNNKLLIKNAVEKTNLCSEDKNNLFNELNSIKQEFISNLNWDEISEFVSLIDTLNQDYRLQAIMLTFLLIAISLFTINIALLIASGCGAFAIPGIMATYNPIIISITMIISAYLSRNALFSYKAIKSDYDLHKRELHNKFESSLESCKI